MMRTLYLSLMLCSVAACSSNPATPTPTPTPTPTTFSLTGRVSSAAGGGITGASLSIADGPNAGKATSTNSAGDYAFSGLTASGFTMTVSAAGFVSKAGPISLSANVVQNVSLLPAQIYQLNGSGNQIFDVPLYITKVRIIADYGGSCQNFIMHIGGRLVANEILGSCSVNSSGRHYDATANITPGSGDTVDSSGVSWQITELR